MPLWWCVAWTSTSLPLSVPRNLAPLSKLVVLSWRRLKKRTSFLQLLAFDIPLEREHLDQVDLGETLCAPKHPPQAPVEVEVLEA